MFFSNPILQLEAQKKTPENLAQRLFSPALQMGYINHNSDLISAGLIIQTSVEYRTKKNLFFRINYDDFSGKINLSLSKTQNYIARIPISELIGGAGYWFTKNRHNFFFIAQPGIRFYENPAIENTNGILKIDQKGSTIGSLRYTLGYEYELFDNVFLNSEIFVGHFLKQKDFWGNSKPYYGITVGISTRIF